MKRFLCSVICLAMLLSCMALPMTQAEELPYYEIDVFSQTPISQDCSPDGSAS